MAAGRHQCMNCQANIFFFFLKKLSAPTSARTWAGFWDWRRGKMIAGCVQWALGLFPPIVLRNPYVNSTLYWKYRMKRPPTPSWVLSNPQPHCLQLTVDFMSGTSISPLVQNTHLSFFAACGSSSFRVAHKLVIFVFETWQKKMENTKSNDIYFLQCIVEIARKPSRIILRDNIILQWKWLIWGHVYLNIHLSL